MYCLSTRLPLSLSAISYSMYRLYPLLVEHCFILVCVITQSQRLLSFTPSIELDRPFCQQKVWTKECIVLGTGTRMQLCNILQAFSRASIKQANKGSWPDLWYNQSDHKMSWSSNRNWKKSHHLFWGSYCYPSQKNFLPGVHRQKVSL